MKFLLLLAGVSLGSIAIIYTSQIVRTFGHLDWAERYLGAGGTYAAWKLIGVACILGGFAALRY